MQQLHLLIKMERSSEIMEFFVCRSCLIFYRGLLNQFNSNWTANVIKVSKKSTYWFLFHEISMLEAAISNKQTHLGHRIKITKSLNRSTFFPLALSVLFREQFFFSLLSAFSSDTRAIKGMFFFYLPKIRRLETVSVQINARLSVKWDNPLFFLFK